MTILRVSAKVTRHLSPWCLTTRAVSSMGSHWFLHQSIFPSTSRNLKLNIHSNYSLKDSSFHVVRNFSTSPRTIKVPSMGDSITEGTLNEWKKQPGDFVDQDELVAIIDTDKVSVDINAPVKGTVVTHLAKPGDTLLVGADLFTMHEGGEAPVAAKTADKPAEKAIDKPVEKEAEKPVAPPPSAPSPPKQSTPAPSGGAPPTPPQVQKAKPSSPPSPQIILDQTARTEERVPMSRLRKRIAQRLKSAQTTAASLTTFQECDMSGLMAMRSELNKEFVDTFGIKFGFVSAFLYSSARALKKMPQLNAYITDSGDEIIYKNYVDISVAVATPTGLLVPVIRDCDRKNIPQLEADLVAIAAKAREGKIALEEMAGGTFTISNGGIFGSLLGTPILNPPQSSILGLHSIKDRPIAKDGEVVIRPMMYLALTYDHRLVDGREAVLFLNRVKNGIEDPRRLLLDV